MLDTDFQTGGATNGDVVEASINLQIAQKLKEQLEEQGYEIIMTREDENNIADENKQSKIAEMKQSDLNNRVKIINESGADFCISIHMNQFQNERFWGWQTFYNDHSIKGKKLASAIQEEICKVILKKNTRTALKIEGIKIVDKTQIPVVIVECGFLSNPEEKKLLQEEAYQEKLVEGICKGVERFYQS